MATCERSRRWFSAELASTGSGLCHESTALSLVWPDPPAWVARRPSRGKTGGRWMITSGYAVGNDVRLCVSVVRSRRPDCNNSVRRSLATANSSLMVCAMCRCVRSSFQYQQSRKHKPGYSVTARTMEYWRRFLIAILHSLIAFSHEGVFIKVS